MKLHGAAARRRLAALVGGAEGATLELAAATWMAEQQVADAERLSAMLLPW